VIKRIKSDGQADVVFAQSDSAFYGMNREWWRDKTMIVNVLTMTGFRDFRYAFDGPDRLYLTAILKSGGVTSGALVRADAARPGAGGQPPEWPWPGESASIPHLTVRTPSGGRPIMLEATFYPRSGSSAAPLAIITHGSDVGRNQLRSWSFSTEAHWLREKGFAVLAECSASAAERARPAVGHHRMTRDLEKKTPGDGGVVAGRSMCARPLGKCRAGWATRDVPRNRTYPDSQEARKPRGPACG
jgi:hypothetical protein